MSYLFIFPWCDQINKQNHNIMLLWTHIFHVRHHSIRETHFYMVKNWFWKSWSRHLFYFILKGKIRQERKP